MATKGHTLSSTELVVTEASDVSNTTVLIDAEVKANRGRHWGSLPFSAHADMISKDAQDSHETRVLRSTITAGDIDRFTDPDDRLWHYHDELDLASNSIRIEMLVTDNIGSYEVVIYRLRPKP